MRLLAFVCACLSLTGQTTPPKSPKAIYSRAREYARLSIQALNELRATAPDSGYAFALLGEIKSQEHQYQMALDAYQQAAKNISRLRNVHSAMADVYLAIGKPVEASKEEAAERELGPPDCVTETFYCDFAAGRFDRVVQTAKLKSDAEHLYWLARGYHQLAAVSFADLSKLPESAEMHEVNARKLRDEGKYRESVQEWRAAVGLAPEDARLQHELAVALFLTQDFRAVLPQLQQQLKAEPASANLNFFVGDSLLETEHVDEAVPYLETALKLDPKLIPAHVALGLCYLRLGDPRRAVPHMEIGLKLDRDGSLHYQLARAYQATGKPDLAKTMMEKYQQLQKETAAPAPQRR